MGCQPLIVVHTLFYELHVEMKRMWMWVGIALVVGILIMGATRTCGKVKNIPYPRGADVIGPPPPSMGWGTQGGVINA
jgi:hypothetical protein